MKVRKDKGSERRKIRLHTRRKNASKVKAREEKNVM